MTSFASRLISSIKIHAHVWLRAVFFGLAAYAAIHLLIIAMNWLKTIL